MKKLTRRELLEAGISSLPAFGLVNSLYLPRSEAQMPPFAFWTKRSAPSSSMAYRGSATGTTNSVTLPTGTTTGDLVVVCSLVNHSSVPGQNATPAGWTRSHNLSLSNSKYATYWRIADSGTTGFSPWSSGTTFTFVTLSFSNASPFMLAGDIEQQMIAGDPTSQSLSTSTATAPVVGLGIYGNTSSTTMAGISATGSWNPAITSTSGSIQLLSVRRFLQTSSSPSTSTLDIGNFTGTDLVMLATMYISS